jgi:alpha-tubulin suppressor-like RCC1 family protein
MLALTNIGTIYSCGDGSSGQLGHGNLNFCHQLYPVTAFVNSTENRIIITQVSVGSNAVGAHSAAVDSNGYVYTWGKSIICGHLSEIDGTGSVESYTTKPKKIKAMEVRCDC